MTISDLLRLTVRLWFVSLVAIACIGLGMVWAVHQTAAVNGRVSIIFLAPTATDGNVLAGTSAALVATTGVVAGQVNGPAKQPQTVSDVTLSSMGIKSGWSVRQPNVGGQWAVHYSDPLLDVRATGRSLGEAEGQMQTALAKVQDALARLQDDAAVPSDMRITTLLNPAEPVYTVQAGSRMRTMAAVGALGVFGWAAALVVVDRLRPERVAEPVRRSPMTVGS